MAQSIWLIKRKGADWFGNYLHTFEVKFDGKKTCLKS